MPLLSCYSMKRGVAPVSVRAWSLLAPASTSRGMHLRLPWMDAVNTSSLSRAWTSHKIRNWDFVAGSSSAQEAYHHFPRCPCWAAMGRGVALCWHRTQPEIGQLQDAPSELLWKEALLQYLSCLALCWHPTQPEIGQLQDAPSELLWKKVLLRYLSCLGLCWHPTPPEIWQLQGAPDELRRIEVLLHQLCLGLCWHPASTSRDTHLRLPWMDAANTSSLSRAWTSHKIRNWDFVVAGSSSAQEANHHFPRCPCWAAMGRGVALCWHPTPPVIWQLQDAPSELLWKKVLLRYLSWLGLCWHPTPPEIWQLQGAPDELRRIEVLLHQLCLGLCWHLLLRVEIRIWDFREWMPQTPRPWAELELATKPHLPRKWGFVAGSSSAQEAYHHVPRCPCWAAMGRGVALCWHPTPPVIWQLQDAPSELLWKRCCSGICRALVFVGAPTPPEIWQLQGAPDELRRIEVLLHQLCLGLCWHLLLRVEIRIWDFREWMPQTPRPSELEPATKSEIGISWLVQALLKKLIIIFQDAPAELLWERGVALAGTRLHQ